MAQIVAKTKQWIETEHNEIEKSIPTELLVQDGKLYLAHDGVALAGQEGQPLIQGEKGDPGEPGAKGDKGDPGASGGVELYQYACSLSVNFENFNLDINLILYLPNNLGTISKQDLSMFLDQSTSSNSTYMCNGIIKDISNSAKVIGYIYGIKYLNGKFYIYYTNIDTSIQVSKSFSSTDITNIFSTKYKLLGVTATLATITQNVETGDISIVTPD